MASKPANTAQKKWMSDITEWAENNIHLLYGDEWIGKPIQRHHVLGRSAKHNKVAIGHWFILPCPFALHDVSSNHPLNVTHNKHKFTDRYGLQSELFQIMVSCMALEGFEVPDMEVYNAIMDTRK